MWSREREWEKECVSEYERERERESEKCFCLNVCLQREAKDGVRLKGREKRDNEKETARGKSQIGRKNTETMRRIDENERERERKENERDRDKIQGEEEGKRVTKQRDVEKC